MKKNHCPKRNKFLVYVSSSKELIFLQQFSCMVAKKNEEMMFSIIFYHFSKKFQKKLPKNIKGFVKSNNFTM
jgi:hypothetical protein